MIFHAQILRVLSLVALAAGFAIAQVLLAVPASAHAALVSATPTLNAKIESLPASVALTFNDEMNQPSQISVLGPDGKKIGLGDTTVDGAVVTRRVSDPKQAGIYRVDYRVVSADGHPVTGSYKFTVTSGVPTSSKSTSEPLKSEKQFTWFIVIVGGLVLILVGLAVAARLRPATDE